MPRIFIIHGWGGSPQGDWMPWAKKALEEKGFEVHVPEMLDTEHPKIKPWIDKLQETIGEIKPDDIFIGHSIGCQTVLRYLQTLPENTKVGKVILIAGWVSLTPFATREPEDKLIVKPWFETPINYLKVKNSARKFIAVFSDNDPMVPYEENAKTYKEKLGAEIILKKGMGHFSQDEGVKEIPFLLELIE